MDSKQKVLRTLNRDRQTSLANDRSDGISDLTIQTKRFCISFVKKHLKEIHWLKWFKEKISTKQ